MESDAVNLSSNRNLSVSWACGESVLKSCTLMRIETLDDLFRTSRAKWMCLFYTLCIPSTLFLHIQTRSSCIRHAAAKFFMFDSKIWECDSKGYTRPLSLLMEYWPIWLLPRMNPANKAFSLGAQQNIADRGRSYCHTHAMHMCTMVTVHSLLTATLSYSCHASCFSIAIHNNKIFCGSFPHLIYCLFY